MSDFNFFNSIFYRFCLRNLLKGSFETFFDKDFFFEKFSRSSFGEIYLENFLLKGSFGTLFG
jgi:hypothetical protein